MVSYQPRTIEEFVSSDWMRKIELKVRSFRLNEDVEDTLSSIVASMIEKDYIARWDPKKGGSFANWIYTFVLNFCRNRHAKSNSRGGRLIEGAVRIENALSGEGFPGSKGIILAEHIPVVDEVGDNRIFAKELLEVIRKRQNEAFSKVVYTSNGYTVITRSGSKVDYEEAENLTLSGRAFNRDWETIYLLLLEGFKISEISGFLKTSVQYVQSQFREIRRLSALVAVK